MAEYLIQGETLTGIADQVRRISGVEGELTPEQMTTNLLNVNPSGEYPKAEESAFGAENASEEHGILTFGNRNDQGSYTNTLGWRITAGEAFSIVGLRTWYPYPGGTVKLWDANGQQIASATLSTKAADGWYEGYLSEPITIAIGETFTVSGCYSNSYWLSTSQTTFNSKFAEVIGMRKGGSDGFPDAVCTYPGESPTGGIVDIIIKPVQAELPNDYQITRNTMDDIAEEVQRITGTTDKMTTAQIVTGLQSVTDGSGLPPNAKLYYVGNAESNQDASSFGFKSSAVGETTEG